MSQPACLPELLPRNSLLRQNLFDCTSSELRFAPAIPKHGKTLRKSYLVTKQFDTYNLNLTKKHTLLATNDFQLRPSSSSDLPSLISVATSYTPETVLRCDLHNMCPMCPMGTCPTEMQAQGCIMDQQHSSSNHLEIYTGIDPKYKVALKAQADKRGDIPVGVETTRNCSLGTLRAELNGLRLWRNCHLGPSLGR